MYGVCVSKWYELIPKNGQKSFYGKALVEVLEDGSEILYSYNTPIIRKNGSNFNGGDYARLYDGWTATTGKHIKSFCGLNKKEFLSLPLFV